MNYFEKNAFITLSDSCYVSGIEHYTRHKRFEVLWFREEEGEHSIDYELYKIKKGSVFLISPGQVHGFKSLPPVLSFSISPNFFEFDTSQHLRFIFNPFFNDGILIGEETASDLVQLIGLIKKELSRKTDLVLVQTYTQAFLLNIGRLMESAKATFEKKDQRMRALFLLLKDNYKSHHNVAYYANQLGITPKRLNEILKEKIGLTVTRLLHIILIHDAKCLIAQGNLTFKEIAFELGFNEQAYFSRFFKKLTGFTPREFKEREPF